jgi:hypothetical protein
MREKLILSAIGLAIASSSVHAQTELSTYADANGYIDVQKLTCAQLAGTFQEDADMLTAWYSGWYNGLAKKAFRQFSKGKRWRTPTNYVLQSTPRNSDHSSDCCASKGRENTKRN